MKFSIDLCNTENIHIWPYAIGVYYGPMCLKKKRRNFPPTSNNKIFRRGITGKTEKLHGPVIGHRHGLQFTQVTAATVVDTAMACISNAR
jgi:hypothetical protein